MGENSSESSISTSFTEDVLFGFGSSSKFFFHWQYPQSGSAILLPSWLQLEPSPNFLSHWTFICQNFYEAHWKSLSIVSQSSSQTWIFASVTAKAAAHLLLQETLGPMRNWSTWEVKTSWTAVLLSSLKSPCRTMESLDGILSRTTPWDSKKAGDSELLFGTYFRTFLSATCTRIEATVLLSWKNCYTAVLSLGLWVSPHPPSTSQPGKLWKSPAPQSLVLEPVLQKVPWNQLALEGPTRCYYPDNTAPWITGTHNPVHCSNVVIV